MRATIVHRDVKPSNIIITNEQGWVRFGDFGPRLGLVATASATQRHLLHWHTSVTWLPEQILGEAIDRRCDIWALGVNPGTNDHGESFHSLRPIREQ